MFLPNEGQSRINGKVEAVFFDPKQEKEAKRKRQLAELLVQKGNQPMRNEVAGGMTVKRSPWEFASQAADKYMGEMRLGEADDAMAQAESRRQQMIQEALGSSDPMQAARVLAQDPNTSEQAIKLYADVLNDQRNLEAQREIFGLKAASGGNTPAAIQIANDIQDALARGDYARANMLYEIGKYSDKGITRFTPQAPMDMGQFNRSPDFVPQGGQQLPPAFQGLPQGAPDFVPQNEGLNLPQGAMPQIPQGQTGDPLQDSLNAIQQQQQQYGFVNPMQRPELMPAPTAGYAEAVARNAALKKRAEQDAANMSDLQFDPMIRQREAIAGEVGKRMGEAEGSLQFLEANMPKLDQVVTKLEGLADKATYTTAGRGRDLVRKELGMETSPSAVARAEYIATVDNEILPLLRDTFGAAFTVKEGETLRNTLGDPNKSPAEKKSVLKAFIDQKKAQVQALQRQTGRAPMQPSMNDRDQKIQRLRDAGIPEQRIQEAINAGKL